MKTIILIVLIIAFGYSDEYYFDNGKKVYLKEINSNINRSHNANNKKETSIKYYTTKSGAVLGVNNDIIVKCKKNRNCKQELLKYDVERVEEISKDYYLLSLHDNIQIFSISRKLYQESYIELAHPDFEMTYTSY